MCGCACAYAPIPLSACQGLVQYFNLVEACEALISERESFTGVPYKYVVRSRPDGLWQGPSSLLPPPSPASLPPNTYVAPAGSRFMGVNDRFAATTRETARLALRRLSALQRLRHAGPGWYRELNSEKQLRMALGVEGVQVKEVDVPFCVLSLRMWVGRACWASAVHIAHTDD